MKKEQKRRAVEPLSEKIEGRVVTYADIALETGYSTRQLKRMAKRIQEEGEESVLTHGNSGSTPCMAPPSSNTSHPLSFNRMVGSQLRRARQRAEDYCRLLAEEDGRRNGVYALAV